jgi:hypothetical protein
LIIYGYHFNKEDKLSSDLDILTAFRNAEANRGKMPMVFDWNKAARLIKEENAKIAKAGLRGCWKDTGGTIWYDGSPINKKDTCERTYLRSTWAVPEIEINGVMHECYIMQDKATEWDAFTYWPESALNIVNDKNK